MTFLKLAKSEAAADEINWNKFKFIVTFVSCSNCSIHI